MDAKQLLQVQNEIRELEQFQHDVLNDLVTCRKNNNCDPSPLYARLNDINDGLERKRKTVQSNNGESNPNGLELASKIASSLTRQGSVNLRPVRKGPFTAPQTRKV